MISLSLKERDLVSLNESKNGFDMIVNDSQKIPFMKDK
jgi:hypothetical protein